MYYPSSSERFKSKYFTTRVDAPGKEIQRKMNRRAIGSCVTFVLIEVFVCAVFSVKNQQLQSPFTQMLVYFSKLLLLLLFELTLHESSAVALDSSITFITGRLGYTIWKLKHFKIRKICNNFRNVFVSEIWEFGKEFYTGAIYWIEFSSTR